MLLCLPEAIFLDELFLKLFYDYYFSFDSYILEFDDDEEDGSLPQRAVPFYRVVALPEGHRQ